MEVGLNNLHTVGDPKRKITFHYQYADRHSFGIPLLDNRDQLDGSLLCPFMDFW